MRHITDMEHNLTINKQTLKIIDNSVKNIKKAKALDLSLKHKLVNANSNTNYNR